jgi:pimeloyl-ACP methyl ester carboxylesterase
VGKASACPPECGLQGHHLRPQRLRQIQPATDYNYDTFAEDLHKLVTQLKLRDLALAGFSMGGGEVARYIGKYGSKGVSKAVILSGVPPYLLKTADNPEGVDGGVFAGIEKAVAADRCAFFSGFCGARLRHRQPGMCRDLA